MSSTPYDLISNALAANRDAVYYEVGKVLREVYPEHAIVETEEKGFNIGRYSWARECEVSLRSDFHNETTARHHPLKKTIYFSPTNCWQKVKWLNHDFEVITVSMTGSIADKKRYFVVGTSQEVVEHFIFTCCDWNATVRGEIMVYTGIWAKDEELFRSIQSTSLDSLVLEKGLKEEIENDCRSFFEAKGFYAKHGVPWKRGVLFLGPPGNGKTHAIKGLVNTLGKPCLYIRSFKQKFQTDQKSIQDVFSRARATAPCLIIMEDIDTLLDDASRSFFLNEMDGFASNEGIMTIATANHPEKLDPAIIHRPSRIDRKYTFNLPGREERICYLSLQNADLEKELSLSEGEIDEIASLTDDFSFAYLKELVLSSMMRWIGNPSIPMAEVMKGQLDTLRLQMRTPAPAQANRTSI